jgi:DNA-binding Lrp family transcriptional regulator
VSDTALRLLNEFQRDFPLCRRPFLEVAARLGCGEDEVLDLMQAFVRHGMVSRIGAVFAPGTIGASALVALAVPPDRLDAVASLVSGYQEVNHNYEREDWYNLWFVVAAENGEALQRVIRQIETASGCGPGLVLPLVEEYRIDLGFDLCGAVSDARRALPTARAARPPLDALERNLVARLQEGLPLVQRPYLALARQAGLDEGVVQALLDRWIEAGVIRRFGVIVRHRELGYHANAMVVWDVPDAVVSAVGLRLAQQAGVNLCYRRARALPAWPFNLYAMLHGRSRDAVLARIDALRRDCGLGAFPSRVLFSRRRFKQQGARYVLPEAAHG